MGKVIGIDFGTTNTVVAYMENNTIKIIANHNGNELTPSVVAKLQDKLLIGEEAKANVKAFSNGDGIKEIKREIGKGERIYFAGEYMYASDIASLILGKVKGNAEEYFEEEVKDAVITVPAEFSDAQRKEIIESAVKAGLNVKKIINEPTAALLAYTHNNYTNKKVLCYDFGGGTFDVSIANISSNGVEVIAVGGDRELGGKDIDEILVQAILDDIKINRKKELSKYGKYQLVLAVEEAKIELTRKVSASISIPSLRTTSGNMPYTKTISRVYFNGLIRKVITKTINDLRDTLDSKNISLSEINEVVLVGGSSKMPIVKQELSALFGNKIIELKDMDKLVAMGAAIEAANISGVNNSSRSKIKRDVCPFSLGLKVYRDGSDNVFDPIVLKNSPYGVEFSEKYNTAFDRQNSMILEIYQGESQCATENEHITDFEITGIPQSAAGEEWVRITFKYDENGIINIKAKILSTGLEKVHQYKYGYDLKRKVDSTIAEKNIIDSNLRITATKAKEQLEKEGLSSLAGQISNHVKYEQKEQLTDILEELYR
ncbi:Hsp70 family protein [Clostridium saudiense]|uniref:Hsp70 family protein n=1 Tax=Clostridium saudiense TaxID=1414720 RepID=UPI00267013CA|nr:Hsp70 family protein [Clostridium saudiense]